MSCRYQYQTTHSFADRLKESTRIRQRYPHHIPIICEAAPGATQQDAVPLSQRRRVLRDLDCSKFLLPGDASVQQLIILLRGRLLLDARQGLFVFISDSMPPSSACLGDIYTQRKDEDGFLYLTYGIESTFGGVPPPPSQQQHKLEE